MDNLGRMYDKAAIAAVIKVYEKLYPTGPDSIAAAILSYRQENAELELTRTISQRTGVINKSESGRRMSFVMPSQLYLMLNKEFPSIFKDDKKKFEKDFPVFFKGWK